ncbi:quinone-dependent dihydroorotate dehydrogenase [Verrucomicrobiaceae bacterium 5K15]|uniref:Dihydroorotate dehydrogenase (quinone) n=1 Tax=Oceaniferula flava TaxID=2800421 RepID=A0AAE2SFI4_9BACT|nr:quinone-dependent dihydroorotate dehydrogenase [Oceaniferula flavus]MBK1855954.1 quinone-dependent dihydroorotate dehydrogenase [Oceaniferula flavus]MBM1137261.1 quinone-dependent dihydroorotate dehydrogenase [Oceaniferula flavus]
MSPSQYRFARNLLFRLDAEKAHHVSLDSLRWLEKTHLLAALSGAAPKATPVECMGITFPNCVGLAAGLDKEGNCIDALGRLGFGSVEIGTITPRPQEGNPQPRLFRIVEKEAIINRMGFNNPGIDAGVANVAASHSFRKQGGVVGFNIGKNKVTPNEHAVDDYLACLRGAWDVADYITVNLSSPNTPGLRDLQAADETAKLLETLKQEQERLTATSGRRVPIALKVAPDLEPQHIADLAKVFLNGGLDGLIATNTTISRKEVAGCDFESQAGGLSGAPLTPRATDVIAEFHSHLGEQVPIIGVGGIMTAEDAQAKLKAGAKLVQLYTGFIYHGPPLVKSILKATT